MKNKDSKKHTKNRTKKSKMQRFAGATAMALLLGMPAAAQPAQSEPANAPAQIEQSGRQTDLRTYQKFPDPSGNNQDFEVSTYDKKPDPEGDEQGLDYVRYDEVNKSNNGLTPVNLTVIDEGDE